MINIKRAKRSDRIMKSLTGLTVKEFNGLIEKFSENITIIFREKRKVNPVLGRPFILRTSEEKLFYILFYIKCYPTFDIA